MRDREVAVIRFPAEEGRQFRCDWGDDRMRKGDVSLTLLLTRIIV